MLLCVGGIVEDTLCAGVSEGCAACIVGTGGRGERALCAWISEWCAACVPEVMRCVLYYLEVVLYVLDDVKDVRSVL